MMGPKGECPELTPLGCRVLDVLHQKRKKLLALMFSRRPVSRAHRAHPVDQAIGFTRCSSGSTAHEPSRVRHGDPAMKGRLTPALYLRGVHGCFRPDTHSNYTVQSIARHEAFHS